MKITFKKQLKLFLLFSFTFSSTAFSQGCSDDYSYLVFTENGVILFEEKSVKMSYPASLVKLMTLYLTFEALEKNKFKSDKILKFSARGEEISKVNKINTMNAKEGDKITVREAIRAIIVKSFNEATIVLAEAVDGSEWKFVRRMNDKTKQLGMFNTSFRNASGLHEEGQYTTSYDLARLVLAPKKDFPQYYHLFAVKEFSYKGVKYETHNHVLTDYEGAEGLKTGFTNASGFNLISAARQGDKRIFSILLNCSTYQKRDQFTKFLLNDAFKSLSQNKQQLQTRLDKKFDYSAKQKRHDDYEEEMRFGMKLENY